MTRTAGPEPPPTAEPAPPGLRERKKQRTRAAIAATALELFLARDFESVRVAEIARAAEVSEATVYNYFPTKEDLVYDRLEQFWGHLLHAVRERPAEVGVVDAVERFLMAQTPVAQSPDDERRLAGIARLIAASPALLARERASYDRAALALAAEIERTTPLREHAITAAQLILAVHRTLVAYTREQLVAGAGGPALARRVEARTRSGYALLRNGLLV